MRTHPWAVLLLCLCPALGGAMDSPSPDSESPLPASYATWRYLTRLEATSGLPQAQAPFPNGFSTYAEAVVAWDGVRLGGLLQRHLSLSLGAEVFGWGRVDVDGRLAAQLAHRNLEVALSGLALGLGQPGARHLYSGQVRWRFGRKLYALAEGGTLLFPEVDGTLRPGAFASLGLGVDSAR